MFWIILIMAILALGLYVWLKSDMYRGDKESITILLMLLFLPVVIFSLFVVHNSKLEVQRINNVQTTIDNKLVTIEQIKESYTSDDSKLIDMVNSNLTTTLAESHINLEQHIKDTNDIILKLKLALSDKIFHIHYFFLTRDEKELIKNFELIKLKTK